MTPGILLGMKLCITVDRIEGGYAVLEWSSGETTAVSKHLLPHDLHEGQPLVFSIRRREGGDAHAVSSHPAMLRTYGGLIELPEHLYLSHGENYRVRFTPLRSSVAESGRGPNRSMATVR